MNMTYWLNLIGIPFWSTLYTVICLVKSATTRSITQCMPTGVICSPTFSSNTCLLHCTLLSVKHTMIKISVCVCACASLKQRCVNIILANLGVASPAGWAHVSECLRILWSSRHRPPSASICVSRLTATAVSARTMSGLSRESATVY